VPDSGPTFVGPTSKTSPQPDAILDIVFVHGLTGDRYTTWQANGSDSFWPCWLAAVYPTVNVYTAGYDSTVFAKVFAGEGPSLIDRSTMLLDGLLSRPVRAPVVVFVAHSLGGLIVKQMLRRCHDAANTDRKVFLESVRAIAFLGTPHQGAQSAASVRAVLGLILSKAVSQLAFGEEQLDDLNEWFRNWAGGIPVTIRAYYETNKTKGIAIVDKLTANPHVHGCDPVALPSDHIGMCKPATREAQLFQSISAMIRDLLIQGGSPSDPGMITSNGQLPLVPAVAVQSANVLREIELDLLGLEPETLVDFQNFTTSAPDDRKTLAEKLTAGGRSYQVRDGERKKEQFSMLLQRHIAQPSALTHYTRIMADVEARFNRHAMRSIALGGSLEAVDQVVQKEVIDPVIRSHSTVDDQVSASTVDGALYYLTGNCHLRWDHGED
jgi:pimeloyl-ACP methyl ester carboxylesterase